MPSAVPLSKTQSGVTPLSIEMLGIVKAFAGVMALDRVDFTVQAGEVHGLVGKNGAGKSTLMGVLTGLYPHDAGTIYVAGIAVPHMNAARAKATGIAIVPQHSQLIPRLSIAENMLCGNLPVNRWGLVDWRATHAEASARLQRFGLSLDVRRRVDGLSVAERQMIEIASALFADAHVIILDEPTAALPKHEVETLFRFVRQQRERGVAFVYISHYLEELFQLCDRVTVLRNGKVAGVHAIAAIDQPGLIQLISGADVAPFRRAPPATRALPSAPIIDIRNLNRPGVYANVSLQLYAGQVVGITGLEGCGKDRLARALFGLEPLGQGEVLLNGQPYAPTSAQAALRQGVAYVPRDRHGLGIIGARSVRENMVLPVLRQLAQRLGFIQHSEEKALVQRYIQTLGIKTTSLSNPISQLSGGNQQKVVVAKLAAAQPIVLFLDEPTQGVDVQAKVEILRIAAELAARGVAVVIVTEELSELLEVCDRIVVMSRGRIVKTIAADSAEATPDHLMAAIES